ncbi:hypothetical protein BGZ60DRAFT_549991 [Tricladium varicosporioides]|nr:hypothetical protein BGZ60DRAFT_549991 [Hymenoscyphus varicosporioides]
MFLRSVRIITVLIIGLFSITNAHFVLEIPTSLGFDDAVEGTAPCGGFDPHDRTTVTNWPVKGAPVGLLTTHLAVTWEFRAALVCNLDHWVSLTPILNQTGFGEFCEPQIPGKKSWIGEPAVFQIIQHSDDGSLYQCAAIKFVNGGPGLVSSGCTNTTGTAAHWEHY